MCKIPKEFEVIEENLEYGIWYEDHQETSTSLLKLCVDKRGNLHIIDTDWFFDMRLRECPCKRKTHYRNKR